MFRFDSDIFQVHNSLRQLLLLYIRHIFFQNLKKKTFLRVGQLGPIFYFVLFLCLYQNYLSRRKLNFMLFFLLFSLIYGLHKWYFPIKFKGKVRITKKYCFGPLSIIKSSGRNNLTSLCTCVLNFFMLYVSCCIRITSLFATAYSSICLEDFW